MLEIPENGLVVICTSDSNQRHNLRNRKRNAVVYGVDRILASIHSNSHFLLPCIVKARLGIAIKTADN